MKILSPIQTRSLDASTIKNKPISSIDLMESAAMVFTNWFTKKFDYEHNSVHIFCGPGNNGGDGLAIARLLHHGFYNVHIYLCKIGKQTSLDFDENLNRLPRHDAISITDIKPGTLLPELPNDAILVDGIFGSGLNRSIEGYWADLIEHLNELEVIRVAIDIPSGLFADQHSEGLAICAHQTFSFELPKLAFFFQENYLFVGHWKFRSIGLMQSYIDELESSNYYIDIKLAKSIFRKRGKFDHKGTFGHALLIAGSYGMIGAALLSTKAALRSGAGLVTLHTPKIAYTIVQGNIPEAIVSIDPEEHFISKIPDLEKYSALGIGPGIGNNKLTISFLHDLIKSYTSSIVLDADALNIIAKAPALFNHLPKGSILTPHPKEFERLFGKTKNDFERNELQRTKSKELGVYIILKGAHTCISSPNGICYFNATGNPGMATAGSGDVLTGMITALLAQNYSARDSAILGVYLHGLAGDLGVLDLGSEEALIAGDIVESIGLAFKNLRE
ncbi:MAG: hydroxyethylthiazole kinase-like uncharacterized protein yjeF [Saprospiraceae bacterium]|jgi:hydroxyethylthiazole kinase-like uncharacterized protein yjeF